MSMHGSLLIVAGLLHLVLTPYSVFISRSDAKPEQGRVLVGFRVMVAVLCFAGAGRVEAWSAADAAWWLRLQLLIAHVILALLLTASILGAAWQSRQRALLLWLVSTGPLVAAGLFTDPLLFDPLETGFVDPLSAHATLVPAAIAIPFVVYRERENEVSLALYRASLLVAFSIMVDALLTALGNRRWAVELLASTAVFSLGLRRFQRFVRDHDELRLRTMQLAEQNQQLATLQEQLVRKEQLATVGELSAVIAQEVRFPLTAIRHAVEELSSAGPNRESLLQSLDDENDRLNRLVRDLLLYARPTRAQFEVVPLADVIEEAADKLGDVDHVDVVVQLDDAPDLIEGDPRLLAVAFAQIVSNAVDAMPSGGELTIRADLGRIGEEPALAIHFSDTGEGMDTLVRARARDPFFTTRSSATGLGLAIVERLVAVHGGQLEIASDDVRGSTVTVLLPAKPTPRGSDPGRISSQPPSK